MQSRQLPRAGFQWLLLVLFLLPCLPFLAGRAMQEDFIDAEGRMQLSLDYLQPETIQSTCSPGSIYILDSSQLAELADVPPCNAEELFVVSPKSGQIFLKGSEEAEQHEADRPHFHGTHSAPWYFAQAITNSFLEAKDSERAGLLFVEDYCYHIWWLASVQSGNPTRPSPADYLLKIYEAIEQSAMWKRSKGVDFVFSWPFHLNQISQHETQISETSTLHKLLLFVCNTFRGSLQIFTENLQGRSMCGASHMQGITAPLVPNFLEEGEEGWSDQSYKARHLNSFEERSNLLHFHGRCVHHTLMNPSRLLRSHIVDALQDQGEDIHAQCTEAGQRLSFHEVLEDMGRSIFCLILPELGQSTRTLSEAMLAGCIPVFVGPPFAAMPFQSDLDYPEFAITLLLSSHEEWTAGVSSHPKAVRGGLLAEEALQSLESLPVFTVLSAASDIVETLRGIPEVVVRLKLAEVAEARKSFIYSPSISNEGAGAVELLTLSLCHHMNLRMKDVIDSEIM